MSDILLLVQKCAHTFSLYDLASGEALKHIVLPNFPHEFCVDPTRRFAYVGLFGIETAWTRGQEGDHRVAVIDLQRREHTRTLDLWPCRRPHGMACDGQGRLYAMSEAQDTLLVFDDPQAQDVPNLAVPSGGIKTHLVTLTVEGLRDDADARGPKAMPCRATSARCSSPTAATTPWSRSTRSR